MASGTGTEIAVGAILVESTGAPNGGFSTTAPNSDITIRNNRVFNSGRTGIWVGELSGGAVIDNEIDGWDGHPELPLFGVNNATRMQLLQDFTQPLVIRNSPHVVQRDNDVDRGGDEEGDDDSSER